MKKILFLSPLPPPHYGSAMSSEMCLGILKNASRKLKAGRWKPEKLFDVRNIKLNYSKDMSDVGKINIDKIRGIFYVKKEIKKTIKEFNPDIIYFVPATYSFGLIRDWIFVREIKKYWKGKILFHIRSRILHRTWKNLFGRKFLKDMYVGQKAIVLGKELIDDLREMIPKKNIYVLPNAIKNEISEKLLRQILLERKKNKQFNILFLSNMDRTKGWTKVLDACKILRNRNFNFRCDFVGGWLDKKDEGYFSEFIKNNKLDKNVFAHGKKTGKEKNEFLQKANVLVFPTEYPMETFGRVILEGYMYGIPVIANGIATIPNIIENRKTGFILKENSGKEIAHLIDHSVNWKEMGINGRKKFLKEFEIEKYKDNFLTLFR